MVTRCMCELSRTVPRINRPSFSIDVISRQRYQRLHTPASSSDSTKSRHMWEPLEALQASAKDVALIQLNGAKMGTQLERFEHLWKAARIRAVTDGAVNSMYHYAPTRHLLPTFISGDFDSAEPDVLEHYKQKGCEIIPTPDQDETDFTKCLRIVTERIKQQNIPVSAIVVLCCHGGDRFDHVMGNLQTLFKAKAMTSLPVYLVTNSSVEFILSKGSHVIRVDSRLRGDWCGLIPIGSPCDHVTTTGLKWNLNNQSLKFGELVSTSNQYSNGVTRVTVATDNFLLWTMGIKL